MSHEGLIPGKAVYQFPARPSDMLRTVQFTRFFRHYRGAPFFVRTQDGWSWSSRAPGLAALRPPVFTATFSSCERLDAALGDAAESTLARAFLDGDLDIQGDFSALLAVAEYTLHHSEGLSGTLIHNLGRLSLDLSRRLKPGHRPASPNWRRAPGPLDLPVDFFEPWLGPLLSHACACFEPGRPSSGPAADSDADPSALAAQSESLRRACLALRLEPGDRLLDLACGWGALALHAARHYSADVLALASCEAQADAVRSRVAAFDRSRRLPGHTGYTAGAIQSARSGPRLRCSVDTRDLRSAPFRSETFDKVADIGLFEQVPSTDLPDCLTAVTHLLVPGGLLLMDRITSSPGLRSPRVIPFRGELSFQPLSRELEAAESAGLELVSLESLQSAFEPTLRLWIRGLRRSAARALASRPDPAIQRASRAWLLWLVETAANFQTAGLQAHRILLRRPPLTTSG